MKNLSIFLMFFCVVCLANAQILDLSIITQSAVTPAGNVHLRTATYGELSLLPGEIEVVSYYNGQHRTAGFSLINEYEQKAIIKAPSDMNTLAFRLGTDRFSIIIPWNIQTNQATQKARFIKAGDDETDEEGTNATSDLKSHSVARMGNSLALMIENTGGSYPFTQGAFIPTNVYIYGAGILNAETVLSVLDFENLNFDELDAMALLSLLSDTNAYFMAYMNLALISSGIYKIPLSVFADPTAMDYATIMGLFSSNLGSINPSVNDGALMMSANITNLANDVDFGVWPGMLNSIIVMPIIMNIANPLGTMSFNIDFGVPTLVYFDSYEIMSPNSNPPVISLTENSTSSFDVVYSQTAGYYPVIAQFKGEDFIVNGVSLDYRFVNNARFSFLGEDEFPAGQFIFSADSLHFSYLDYEPEPEESDSDITVLPIKDLFTIYPNPIQSNMAKISFTSPVKAATRIEIFNIKGQKVRGFEHNDSTPNISLNALNLESGIYFVRVANRDFSQTKRVVVLK
jgi:hypothetical protein